MKIFFDHEPCRLRKHPKCRNPPSHWLWKRNSNRWTDLPPESNATSALEGMPKSSCLHKIETSHPPVIQPFNPPTPFHSVTFIHTSIHPPVSPILTPSGYTTQTPYPNRPHCILILLTIILLNNKPLPILRSTLNPGNMSQPGPALTRLRHRIPLRLLIDFHPGRLAHRFVPEVGDAPVLPFVSIGEVYVEDLVDGATRRSSRTRIFKSVSGRRCREPVRCIESCRGSRRGSVGIGRVRTTREGRGS